MKDCPNCGEDDIFIVENKALCMKCHFSFKVSSYEDGPNMENQVKVRQQKIEQQEELIRILTKDLVTVCAASYEIIIKAQVQGSEVDEVAMHLQSCLAVLSKFTQKEENEPDVADEEVADLPD